MLFLPSSWLYPGKEQRKLVMFDNIASDSLLHSILHAISSNYRSRERDIDKHLYLTRFKSALRNEFPSYNDKNTIETISKAFELNIYVLQPVDNDTVIVKSHHTGDEFPYIFIGLDDVYKPMGVHMNDRVHLVFYESHDEEIIRSLVSFDKSGLSDDYKSEPKQFKFMNSYLKYDVKNVLKSVTTKK